MESAHAPPPLGFQSGFGPLLWCTAGWPIDCQWFSRWPQNKVHGFFPLCCPTAKDKWKSAPPLSNIWKPSCRCNLVNAQDLVFTTSFSLSNIVPFVRWSVGGAVFGWVVLRHPSLPSAEVASSQKQPFSGECPGSVRDDQFSAKAGTKRLTAIN